MNCQFDDSSSGTSKISTISIVSPCFNEQEVIFQFYTAVREIISRIPGYQWQVIFVDDGSSDRTWEALAEIASGDPMVEAYSLSRNFGHQAALSAGIERAVGDVIIMLDSDMQHPPELISEFLQQWRAGCDVVLGVRMHTADASWAKKFTSGLFYRVFNFLSPTKLTPGVADFALITREVQQNLLALPEKRRFLRGLIAWLGFKTGKVPYVAQPRAAGWSKYNWTRMIRLAADALTSFTAEPLRLAGRLGFFMASLGVIYLTYILVAAFTTTTMVSGWASTISCIIILSGVQLVFVGVLGEYMARIYDEIKGRPTYVVRRSVDDHKAANESLGKFNADTQESEDPQE